MEVTTIPVAKTESVLTPKPKPKPITPVLAAPTPTKTIVKPPTVVVKIPTIIKPQAPAPPAIAKPIAAKVISSTMLPVVAKPSAAPAPATTSPDVPPNLLRVHQEVVVKAGDKKENFLKLSDHLRLVNMIVTQIHTEQIKCEYGSVRSYMTQ